MAKTIQDVMTKKPVMCDATTVLTEAAELMRDRDIGDVLVERDGTLCGLVTDRDIVVRGVADGKDPNSTPIGDICSRELATTSPSAPIEDVIKLMQDQALRRMPVLDNGKAVGIVSLGDLAIEGDGESALADISAANPTTDPHTASGRSRVNTAAVTAGPPTHAGAGGGGGVRASVVVVSGARGCPSLARDLDVRAASCTLGFSAS
jgi:CBS domain-containing protein